MLRLPPYARTTKSQGKELFRYTDKLRESVTGLYYSMARWYDPQVGRFVSEDSNMGSLTDPMSLNRYVYARDNPMTLVDPSGKVYTDEQAYGDTNACTTADCSLTQAQMDANNAAMVGETMYDPVGTTSSSKVSGTKTTDVTLTQQGKDQYSPTPTIGLGGPISASLVIVSPGYNLGIKLNPDEVAGLNMMEQNGPTFAYGVTYTLLGGAEVGGAGIEFIFHDPMAGLDAYSATQDLSSGVGALQESGPGFLSGLGQFVRGMFEGVNF